MECDIYFDESGDLGWQLDNQYRNSGSSTFFTIAYLIIPSEKKKHITRFIKKFHKERNGKDREYKGTEFSARRAKTMARSIAGLFEWNNDITIGSITVDKRTVPSPLVNSKSDSVLYDYMVQRGICDKIIDFKKINIIPDKRSVPKGSQNSCSDLIKSKLWIELGSTAKISYNPLESHTDNGLMFIDWIANFVWRNFENGQCEPFEILSKYTKNEVLF